jgi:hypothetical protein
MSKKETDEKPQLSFDGQRENENLLFIFRRHMIAMRKGFYLLVYLLLFYLFHR